MAVDAVNFPVAFMVGKQLVKLRKSVSAEVLSNPNIELKSLI
ncbi:oxidoreductase C-terminal domain-containing protein [Alcanivorax sp. HI0044]|nr:oxidoreductase C-terminal domain-containing protein [Alcanivorax sp. HI0044]